MSKLLGLSAMQSNTHYAPLALLGYRLQQRDFFAPLRDQVHLKQKSVFYTPQEKLLTCLVSIMSGCHAICQINTRIRPDKALAQAWGLPCFAQQSLVADTLNSFTESNVQELHDAISRSEEHTSELQSRSDLVCRLLLEKKQPLLLIILASHRRAPGT